MRIIKSIFWLLFLLAAVFLISYGWYYWYTSSVQQEKAASAAYQQAVRFEQSRPPAKVRTIEIPTAEDPYSGIAISGGAGMTRPARR
ncbi:MAG: hypothetical protein LBI01_00585 [Elusimicrobium sp.]|jgi:predicted negative regulator of RcsB-dependent stress response|nr:hypothetical protein [Elusimicrobium sp.]